MKISENQIFHSVKWGDYKIIKIIYSGQILIEFINSGFKYLVHESAILKNQVSDYKQDRYLFFHEEHKQKSGDIIIVLSEANPKEGHRMYNCIFKETLNKVCSQKSKILNGELTDRIYQKGHYNTELSNLYSKWLCIKSRCLNSEVKSYKNYGEKGIIICEEWLDFENFKNWYYKNKYEDNLSIDKDILYNINHLIEKKYSPETCLLLPTNLNCWFASDNKNVGVTSLENNRYKAKIKGRYLGTFDTFEEAKRVYAEEKYKMFLIELEKYTLPNNLKELLLKYDFTWWWQW